MTRFLTFTILLLLSSSLSSADGLPLSSKIHESWRWSRFGIESGLPAGRILRIIENDEGQAWAHTTQGLAWFDEFSWQPVLRNRPGAEGIAGGWMTMGKEGALVVAHGALYRVDTSGYHHVPLRWKGRVIKVKRVCETSEGGMIVQSDSALYLARDGSLRHLPSPYEDLLDSQLADHPFGIWPTSGRGVWLNASQGLFRWESGTWVLKEPAANSFFHIHGLADDGKGTVLVSYEAAGVAGMLWIRSGEIPQRTRLLRGQFAVALDIAERGEALVAYLAGDIHVAAEGAWTPLEPLPPQMTSATSLHFRSNGDLWVASEGGIFLCRLSSDLWSFVRHTTAGRSNNVNAIVAASDGNLWFGTSNGLSVLRPDGSLSWIDRINGEPLGFVTGLGEDAEGGIWVSSGVSFQGAHRWHNGRWTRFGPAAGLPAFIHHITLDRQSRLWLLGIGPHPLGLYPEREPGAYRFDGSGFDHFGIHNGLLSGRVYDVAQRTDSSLWFATAAGLSVLHRGQWKHWTVDSGLRDRRVFTVTADASDRVWFGHQWPVGLGCIGPSGELQYFGTEDGLVSNNVWDVLSDSTQRLWVSTRGGLSSYQNGVWSSFTTRTGLPNGYLWPLAVRPGSLYVGTMGGGMAVFRYGHYDFLPPIVHLTGPFERSGQTVLQWHAHAHWGEIPDEQIETRYSIDEGPWSSWGRYSEVVMEEPDPGEHIFRVQGKGYLGNVAPLGISMRYTTRQPFYLQPQFFGPVLLLAVIGIAAILIAWMRKRQYTAEMRESEERYRVLSEQTGQLVYDYHVKTGRIRWSGAIEEVTGHTPEEFSRVDISRWEEMIHPDDRQAALELLEDAQGTGEAYRVEYRFRHRMGGYVYIYDNGIFLIGPDGVPFRMLGTMTNISTRKVAEEQVLASLREKEVLLKEIHHRVKNNMQIISSLLNLQAHAVNDRHVRESFRESQNRIRSMALVHEKLYRSGSLERIDFGEYVRHLTADLLRSYDSTGVTLSVEAASVELGVDAAVPCGLIIHELVSNSMKHGFRDRDGGLIRVCLEVLDGGQHMLSVSDDGAGFPPHIDFRSTDSLGLQLVNTLTSQLGGSVDLASDEGWTTFTVSFTPQRT